MPARLLFLLGCCFAFSTIIIGAEIPIDHASRAYTWSGKGTHMGLPTEPIDLRIELLHKTIPSGHFIPVSVNMTNRSQDHSFILSRPYMGVFVRTLDIWVSRWDEELSDWGDFNVLSQITEGHHRGIAVLQGPPITLEPGATISSQFAINCLPYSQDGTWLYMQVPYPHPNLLKEGRYRVMLRYINLEGINKFKEAFGGGLSTPWGEGYCSTLPFLSNIVEFNIAENPDSLFAQWSRDRENQHGHHNTLASLLDGINIETVKDKQFIPLLVFFDRARRKLDDKSTISNEFIQQGIGLVELARAAGLHNELDNWIGFLLAIEDPEQVDLDAASPDLRTFLIRKDDILGANR